MNKSNDHFIEQIKQKIDRSAADKLSDILPLSKEAIYRRLRGDVLFTLDEAVIVARQLNISLDTINTNAKQGNFCTFELTMPQFEDDPTDAFIKSLYSIERSIQDVKQEGTMLFQVRPSMPPHFLFGYDSLFKFYYFRWIYLSRGRLPFAHKFSNIAIRDALREAKDTLSITIDSIDITILLSELVFEFLLKEIEHFHILNILNKDDIRLLTDDLQELINDLEKKIAIGVSKYGHAINIYLIDSIQDNTFGFTEGARKKISFIKFTDLNQGVTENEAMYTLLRRSFYDMKGYATLITESASAKRTAFFTKQRALLDKFILKYSCLLVLYLFAAL